MYSNGVSRLHTLDKSKKLVTYVMGGDPTIEESLQTLKTLADNGADIIELGMPFSDPMADGKTIQAAAKRVLANNTNLDDVLNLLAEFRKTHTHTPVILMGYLNPVLYYGLDKFFAKAQNVGVDGLLIVDLPLEESAELEAHSDKFDIPLIRLVAPTTKGERLKSILSKAKGFVYIISIAGVTGTKEIEFDNVKQQVAQVRKLSDIPIAVGFGIKTPTQAAQAAELADYVVIGSAIIDKMSDNQRLQEFVKEVKKSV